MKAGAIILAAGESSRMGRPKPFLEFRGGTFLSVLGQTLGRFCSPVVAVFGASAPSHSSAAMEATGLEFVMNANYKLGMLTSLQAGIRALPANNRNIVLFTLVDHPAINSATVEALIASQAPIAIPRYLGKRGHPVALRGAVVEEIAAEPATSKIHDVINRHAAEIEYIDVNDSGVCDDVDDPAAYERLILREAEPA